MVALFSLMTDGRGRAPVVSADVPQRRPIERETIGCLLIAAHTQFGRVGDDHGASGKRGASGEIICLQDRERAPSGFVEAGQSTDSAIAGYGIVLDCVAHNYAPSKGRALRRWFPMGIYRR